MQNTGIVIMKIQKIEVEFPVAVELPLGFDRLFDAVIDLVCEKYEAQNPTRVMWPAGHGSKPIWREPEEPEFDDSILHISVSERAATPKELKIKNRLGI